MKYMIDTRKISQKRPSPTEVARNKWKHNELKLIGLTKPYDEQLSYDTITIEITQFNSSKEYSDTLFRAFELLSNFQPIPEPLRTKLILEAENIRKNSEPVYT